MTHVRMIKRSRRSYFNPCFSGSYIMTSVLRRILLITLNFNPCFSGSYIMTADIVGISRQYVQFQSLF